jgi:predicted Zn-dependent protease
LTRYHAAALLKARRPGEAYALLKPLIRQGGDDPTLHRLFGTAAGELGRRPEAHQALAEDRYLSGDLPGAIQQLQIASREAKDNFYLISSIEARIAAIRDEIALQQKNP